MLLKYKGDSDVRTISKSEWKDAGEEGFDHDDVRWDASNSFIAEVDDDAAQWLLRMSPDQFKVPTDKELEAAEEEDEG